MKGGCRKVKQRNITTVVLCNLIAYSLLSAVGLLVGGCDLLAAIKLYKAVAIVERWNGGMFR